MLDYKRYLNGSSTKCDYWITEFSELKRLIISLFPNNKEEKKVLFFFFLLYPLLAFYIMFNANLYNNPFISADLYFSYDSLRCYHKGVENYEGHPLLYYILYPILKIGSCLRLIFKHEISKVVFINVVSAYLVFSSIMYVYRYLRAIIELKRKISLLMIFFYSLFLTCIILSFIFESFTFSLYLLSFGIYYYSDLKKRDKKSYFSDAFLTILLGAVTITNLAKGALLMFFTKNNFRTTLFKIIYISVFFLIVFMYLEYRYNTLDWLFKRYKYFTNMNYSLYENAIDLFIGAPILLPELLIKYSATQNYLVIITDYYHKCWQYLFTGILWGVFIVPLTLGWGYNKRLNNKQRKVFTIILVTMILVLLVNNINWVIDFVQYSKTLYPIDI